ncbi:MAG: HEAT repeat domain-containing protein [Candidatus Hydrogenedentes bacterium]|nr:HEAT repeat domain-containing protein [Candidatus Hydrogenedentota bacterium]
MIFRFFSINKKKWKWIFYSFLFVFIPIILWYPADNRLIEAPVKLNTPSERIIVTPQQHDKITYSLPIGKLQKQEGRTSTYTAETAEIPSHSKPQYLKKYPCMSLPIPVLLEGIVNDSEDMDIWGIAALATRHDEAAPLVEAMLRNGSPWQQYSLARKLKDVAGEHYKKSLVMLATASNTHPQARIGAFYGISNIPLENPVIQTLLHTARNTTSPLIRRTALIALSGSRLSGQINEVKSLFHDPDPLTRLYAARLLLEEGEEIPTDTCIDLSSHDDYLVREEAYSLLGYYDDKIISDFLKNAGNKETNHSAARSIRIALWMQRLRSHPDQTILSLLDMEDNRECWQCIQYAMHHNKTLGIKALTVVAESNSPLSETSLAQLITMQGTDPTEQYEKHSSNTENTYDTPRISEKHFTIIHASMAQYNVKLHNTQESLPKINDLAESPFVQATILEDTGTKPVTHAHNPLTGRGFIRKKGFGGSARLYALELLEELDTFYAATTLSYTELYDAWYLAGRIFHLLQDMTSPLHIFSEWHILNACHFELYWYPLSEEVFRLVDLWDIQPTNPPHLPAAATALLDTHTRSTLEQRIENLPNTLISHMDAQSWSTYYRASFWGELRYDEEAVVQQSSATTFDDGEIKAHPNILGLIFDGNIRYHPSWWGDYFEITDRLGNTFSWNRMRVLNAWRPCPNPFRQHLSDGHISLPVTLDNEKKTIRITGRFFFTHKGTNTPYCYPFTYPDGTIMSEHLVQYYGTYLFPVMVAYNGGWLASLAKHYPDLFQSETAAHAKDNETEEKQGVLETIIHILQKILYGNIMSLEEESHAESTFKEYLRLHPPCCGCTP